MVLKIGEIYSLTVLGARHLKSNHWQGHASSEGSRAESVPLYSFWWPTAILGVVRFATMLFQSLPCFPGGILLNMSLLSLKGHQSLDLGITLKPEQFDLNILNWLYLQRPFPNKVTFWSSRWTWIWGHTIQTTIIAMSPYTANAVDNNSLG